MVFNFLNGASPRRTIYCVSAMSAAAAIFCVGPAVAQTDPEPTTEIETSSVDTADDPNIDAGDPEAKAVAFIERLIDEAAGALTNDSADEVQRLEDFQIVLREALALSFLSKFMVGRTVYEGMSDAQRERYETIFPDYITKQYAEQFDGILGQPLEVSDTITRRSDIFVRTQFIRSEGGPINVDWRTRAIDDGALKVRDIIVNGASIMTVKRSEFAAVIDREGVDRLIDILIVETTKEQTVSDAVDETEVAREDSQG